jgi:carboxymethylenebutenolidase
MLAFVDPQPEVAPGAVGCHGYCMSGPYALAAAARYPDRVAAAASLYGTWLVNDAEESPHLSLDKVKGRRSITALAFPRVRCITKRRRSGTGSGSWRFTGGV